MASSSFLNRFIKATVVTVAVTIVLVVSLLPFVIRWQAIHWFEDQGLDADIGYINIRPILGSVQINDVHISASDVEQFVLDKIVINIDWSPLFANWIKIEHVLIDGVAVDVAATPSGLRVGGIALSVSNDTEDAPTSDEQAPPAFRRLLLNRLEIANSQFCYLQLDDEDAMTVRQCIVFDELSLIDRVDVHLGEQSSAEIGGLALNGFRWLDHKQPAELLGSVELLGPVELLGIAQLTVGRITSENLASWQVADVSLDSMGLLPVRNDDEKIVAGDLHVPSLSLSQLSIGDSSRIESVVLPELGVNLNLAGGGGAVFSPRLMSSLAPLIPESSENRDGKPKSNASLTIGSVSLGELAVAEASEKSGPSGHKNLLSLRDLSLQQLTQRGSSVVMEALQVSDINLLPVVSAEGKSGDLQLDKLTLSDLSIGGGANTELSQHHYLGSIALSGVKLKLRAGKQGELAFAPALMSKIDGLSSDTPEQDIAESTGKKLPADTSPAFTLKKLFIDDFEVSDGDRHKMLMSFQNLDLAQLSLQGSDVALDQFQVSDVFVLPSVSEAGDVVGDFQLQNMTLKQLSFGNDSHISALDLSGIHVNLEADDSGRLTFAPSLLARLLPEKEGDSHSQYAGSEPDGHGVSQAAETQSGFSIDQLIVDGASVRDKSKQRDLLLFNDTRLSGLRTRGDALSLNALQINQLKVMESQAGVADAARYYFETPQLEFSGIEKTVDRIGLKKLLVSDPEIFLYRNAEGDLQLIKEVEQILEGDTGGKASASTPEDSSSETASAINFSVGHIAIGSAGRLSVLDKSVTPNFKKTYHDLNFVINQLDSSTPDTSSELSFGVKLDKFGYISLDGNLQPFGEKLNAAIEGKMRGLDARSLSLYASQYIGYSLDQGIGEADINFVIRDDDIDAAIVTRFNKLKVSPLSKGEMPEGAESLGVPLDFALGLLRDKNGMIELKLPINGDIHSPNFSLHHIIGKVMFKVISETIVNYYLPFGLILSETLGDTLSNLSFEPVMFAPGDIALDAAATANLDKLSEMLNSREQLHLSFCAPSTWQDWAMKYAPEAMTVGVGNGDAKPVEDKPAADLVTPEQLATLRQIANQRSDAVKEYLLNKGVQTGQVILCEGDFERENKGLPQMNIAI